VTAATAHFPVSTPVPVDSSIEGPAIEGDAMSMEQQLDVLHQVFGGFNRHDLDAIMAHFADDCVFESPRGPDPWGRRFVGKVEVRRGLAARFEGIPDVHYSDDAHFTVGDRGVSEWTITGTTTDGQHIEVRGCDLRTFDEQGRIICKDSFWKIRDEPG
jgi:ketosteroid isomerase-like protein